MGRTGEGGSGLRTQRRYPFWVDVGASAGDIGHAGDPQSVAQPCVDDLAFEVGDADARRSRIRDDRRGQAVAFERIERHANVQRSKQRHARRSGGEHDVIRVETFVARVRCDFLCRALTQLRHRSAEAKTRPALAQ